MSDTVVVRKSRAAMKSARGIFSKLKKELSFDNINPELLTGMMVIQGWPLIMDPVREQNYPRAAERNSDSKRLRSVKDDKHLLLDDE
uniref:NR LBD domain-containing protein n=1 Tax=Steinernema glaseri TaxID=37863 RepID=A0A1I8AM57_9BILA